MHELKRNNLSITVSQINTNTVRKKTEPRKELISDNVNTLTISETKIHDTFPEVQFCIDG